ncbi:MAG: hypothetical protein CVU41_12540 [Chloroflexi bacterium HGW-Chloroflexi-3]|nr:MAG: hypothetical protein CVU41_12540 [Chloroflexi bacterium HGW-Chloroflexi-3]
MSRICKLLFVFLLSLVVIGCSLLPGAKPEEVKETVPSTEVSEVNEVLEEEPDNSPVEEVVESEVEVQPFVLENSGPAGFTAELTAPDIVLLKWNPLPGATGYELFVSQNNLHWYRIANLPGERDRFEDLLATENSLLSYRLVALTAAGESGTSSLQIQTQPRNPNPLNVQSSFEDDLAVTALVGPEGGTLSLSDSKGVNYSLEIPKNALLLEMEVSMTPVSNISNWPLDGNLQAGVHLEPDGWLLYEPAMLTISLPASYSSGLAMVGFGFNGSGEEFHLTTAYLQSTQLNTQLGSDTYFVRNSHQQNARVIRLPVMELKGNGVGESSEQTAGDLAKNNQPTNPSNANDQKAAAASVDDDIELAPLLSPEELASRVPYNMYNQIFSIKDCYEFKKAAAAFQSWESGASSQQKANWSQDLLENFGKKAVEVAKAAAKECADAGEGVVPSSVPCAEKLIRDIQSGSTPFFQELQNAMKSTPGALGELLKAQKDLEKCPHSFKVNDATTLGIQWTSGCIPSLDRPFQIKFKAMDIVNQYRLYPSNPFSGKLEGDGGGKFGEGTINYVYTGTYKVEILSRESSGKIKELDILTSMERTTIICDSGECVSFEDEVESAERIPILVNPTRCEIP